MEVDGPGMLQNLWGDIVCLKIGECQKRNDVRLLVSLYSDADGPTAPAESNDPETSDSTRFLRVGKDRLEEKTFLVNRLHRCEVSRALVTGIVEDEFTCAVR